jgi:hypothetical protein
MYVLNDSIIFSGRIKKDYGTKRVLNFDSVVNEHNELINMKKRVIYDVLNIRFKRFNYF